MKNNETNAEALYHKLGKFNSITMFDTDGNETIEVASAVLFQMDYSDSEADPKIVTVNLIDPENFELIFSKDITADMDSGQKGKWYQFIDELRDFALTRFMGFKVHDITKARFDKNDFDFIRKNNMESKMYGSKKSSYHEGANKTRLIIKHTQPVQEEVQGSRSRNIKSIYIENAQGERFLMPINHLPTARAMARHVANEGRLDDQIGSRIVEMFTEMSTLRTFNRKFRNTDNMMEGAADILEATKWKYQDLRTTLESLQRQRGYDSFVESYEAPALNETDEEKDYSDLKEKLTRHTFEDEEEDSFLPTVDTAFSDFEDRQAARQMDNDAASKKNLGDRRTSILGMKFLTLAGGQKIDDDLRKQYQNWMDQNSMKKHANPEDKKEAFNNLKFQILQHFKDHVLNRMPKNLNKTDPGETQDAQLAALNARDALDFTHGKDDFMHKGFEVSDDSKAIGLKLFMLWNEGKVKYIQQEARQTESEVFEAWAEQMVEYGEDEFEREKNPYEQVAAELEEYAYKVGNTDMDYEEIMQVADHLKNDEYDEAGRIVNQMDTEPREVVGQAMIQHDLYDVVERWMEPMDSEGDAGSFNDDGSYNTSDDEAGEFDEFDDEDMLPADFDESLEEDEYASMDSFTNTFTPEEINAIKSNPDNYDNDPNLWQKLFDYFSEDMPYGTQKGRTGDPYEYVHNELDTMGVFDDQMESKEKFDYYESVQSITKLAGIK